MVLPFRDAAVKPSFITELFGIRAGNNLQARRSKALPEISRTRQSALFVEPAPTLVRPKLAPVAELDPGYAPPF
jgi:hypothetical protein